ncbi:CBO0543 family protein [Pontibacillus salicampi]|uniref:CBO0543 family protein n=1 Tax=Pontibacillus salicampi TaxID=1449801 RepID=A0ABV6LN42_9BACI
MYLLMVVMVWILFALIFLDKAIIQQTYQTVQYFIIFNLVYNFLYYNHTLWEYQAITTPVLNHTFIELSFTFIILPIAVVVYLKYFPVSRGHQIWYLGWWVVFFTFIEFLFYRMNMFVYDNGWGVLDSLWFNVLMFFMIRLHFLKPMVAFLMSIIITIVLIQFFPIPLDKLK